MPCEKSNLRDDSERRVAAVPHYVRLLRLAMAAGRGGYPTVTIMQGFSQHVLACLIARVTSNVSVLNVHKNADLEEVQRRIESTGLVVVHHQRHLNNLAWMMALDRSEEEMRPAILASLLDYDCPDLPIPCAVIRANEDNTSDLVTWLREKPRDLRWPPLDIPLPRAASSVRSVLTSTVFSATQLLHALTAGSAVLRVEGNDGPNIGTDDSAYALHVLECARAILPGDSADPLARAMICRANYFLKCHHHLFAAQYQVQSGDGQNLAQFEKRLTRCDLVNLGNPTSREVRRMLESISKDWARHGKREFSQLGLIRTLLDDELPAEPPSVEQLRDQLISWTEKQVRTHFHPLATRGVITATREPKNGPWFYRLPESFASSPLLISEMLRDTTISRAHLSGQPCLPPVCPDPRADAKPLND